MIQSSATIAPHSTAVPVYLRERLEGALARAMGVAFVISSSTSCSVAVSYSDPADSSSSATASVEM